MTPPLATADHTAVTAELPKGTMGDRSGNVWWLAVLSMGESWHNLHHADPTCARTGVLRGQVDSGARVIQLFEAFGWAYDVRWPRQERLDARRATS
jgi:stearoyl-CoA desaturase (Delta-9 desaturase)